MPPDRASAVAALPDRVAFLGLGLIGGSVAMALRAGGYGGHIAAWTPTGSGPRQALERGLIDRAAPTAAEAIDGARLIVLAGPPLAVLEAIDQLGGPLAAGVAADAIITDVASTKVRIVERAAQRGLRFVGGHPMAGRESSGLEAAMPDLFEGRPWVVTGEGDAVTPERRLAMDLAGAVGAFSVSMPADEHDAAVAAISHLPLVVSAALVASVAESPLRGWASGRALAASGWRDMSRLARGDAEMGAGILATNAGPVRERLQELRIAVDEWIEALDADPPDAAGLRDRLARARAGLEAGLEP